MPVFQINFFDENIFLDEFQLSTKNFNFKKKIDEKKFSWHLPKTVFRDFQVNFLDFTINFI